MTCPAAAPPDPRRPGVRHQTAARDAPTGATGRRRRRLDLQGGGMMALVTLRDAAAKVFRLTTADRLIAVFCTVAEVAARD
jgi:hypothetical protein